jgi:hypothetical protein
MMIGACTAAMHERNKLSKNKGKGSNGLAPKTFRIIQMLKAKAG